ncbi:LptA/OstA family protein [Thermodesulfobacteriota bacterium]
MKTKKFKLFFFINLVLALSIFLGSAWAKTLTNEISEGEDVKIVIDSKVLEVDNIKKIVTFSGGVRAVRGDFTIECRKMEVFYEGLSDGKKTNDTKARIKEIVASGKVKVLRAQGGMATAEKGVFYESEDKVVLTGNPLIKRGGDSVQGDRITIFLKEDRSVVEGRAKAIINPNENKGLQKREKIPLPESDRSRIDKKEEVK